MSLEDKRSDDEERGETITMEQGLDNVPESSGGKPVFDKITTLKIADAEFRIEKKVKEDSNGKKYFGFWLSMTYEDTDGNQSYESYGGGRRYESKVDWVGKKSALGELKVLIEASLDGFDGSWKSMLECLKGQKVGVLTVDRKGSKKNLIQHFK